MDRLALFLCVVLTLSAAAPGFAAGSRRTVGCSGDLSSGADASCTTTFRLPHFNARDSIDYGTLVARVDSPQATSWRVTVALSDTRGVIYVWWTCAAGRSSVTMSNETYLGRS